MQKCNYLENSGMGNRERRKKLRVFILWFLFDETPEN